MGTLKNERSHTEIIVDEREKESRIQETIQTLQERLKDDSGYDDQVWPTVQKRIEENRLSARHRFHEKNPS